jgi:hypothetical protein
MWGDLHPTWEKQIKGQIALHQMQRPNGLSIIIRRKKWSSQQMVSEQLALGLIGKAEV